MFLTYFVDAQMPWDKIEARVRRAAAHPLHRYDPMLWLHGHQDLPRRRDAHRQRLHAQAVGREQDLLDHRSRIIAACCSSSRSGCTASPGWCWARTAIDGPSVGDGAVAALVDAYERVNRELPVRPCGPASAMQFHDARRGREDAPAGRGGRHAARLAVARRRTLRAQFGDERLALFQPYKAIFERGVTVGGGSDHMQKIGRRRSINPYDPFLGIWTTLVRRPRWTDAPLHAEQCAHRAEAIRLYTINNAFLTFEEKEKGSLEAGKLADFIVLDRDILTCPIDAVKDINVRETWLGGHRVFSKK